MVKKHSALTEEELSQTKKTLIQLSHRLRMQIPCEMIEISKDKLLPEEDVKEDGDLDTLSSLRLVNSEHVVTLLKQVEAAIARINEQNYGVCTRCGGSIDKAVLLDNITENTCTNCKEKDQSG